MVECGGMLTFDTHLVDIGDPEVGIGPSADLNVGLQDENLKERAGAHGQKVGFLYPTFYFSKTFVTSMYNNSLSLTALLLGKTEKHSGKLTIKE